jgi:hypothetical protein
MSALTDEAVAWIGLDVDVNAKKLAWTSFPSPRALDKTLIQDVVSRSPLPIRHAGSEDNRAVEFLPIGMNVFEVQNFTNSCQRVGSHESMQCHPA